MEMVRSSEFVENVIAMGKDFDAEWINEMIVSRILVRDFDAKIEDLAHHVSGNEMNGARYAIKIMEELR